MRRAELPPATGFEVLMESDEAGLCLIDDPRPPLAPHVQSHRVRYAVARRRVLARHQRAESPSHLPAQLFPEGRPGNAPPENRWRSHAHLLFGNWINEVYQTTPFEVARIGMR